MIVGSLELDFSVLLTDGFIVFFRGYHRCHIKVEDLSGLDYQASAIVTYLEVPSTFNPDMMSS